MNFTQQALQILTEKVARKLFETSSDLSAYGRSFDDAPDWLKEELIFQAEEVVKLLQELSE